MKQTSKQHQFEQDLTDKRAVCGTCRTTMKKSGVSASMKPVTDYFEQDIPRKQS